MAPLLVAASLALPLTAAPAAAELLIQVNKSVSADDRLAGRPVSLSMARIDRSHGGLEHTERPASDRSAWTSTITARNTTTRRCPIRSSSPRTGDAIHGTDETRYIGPGGIARLRAAVAPARRRPVEAGKAGEDGEHARGADRPGARQRRRWWRRSSTDQDVTGAGAPSYQRRWTNGRASYQEAAAPITTMGRRPRRRITSPNDAITAPAPTKTSATTRRRPSRSSCSGSRANRIQWLSSSAKADDDSNLGAAVNSIPGFPSAPPPRGMTAETTRDARRRALPHCGRG